MKMDCAEITNGRSPAEWRDGEPVAKATGTATAAPRAATRATPTPAQEEATAAATARTAAAPGRALVEYAVEYAARGWRVLPCKPGQKTPATRHGVKDASSDEATIRAWWRQWPTANIALACGPESGVYAVDIDFDEGKAIDGFESLKTFPPLPDTVFQDTPRGGRHYLFRLAPLPDPDEKPLPPASKNNFRTGIDIRSEGYYILLSPSVHPNGGRYAWVEGHAPGEIELAEYPDFMRPELEKPKARPIATSATPARATPASGEILERAIAYLDKCPPAVEGHGGHDSLLWAARAMVSGFLLDDATATELLWAHYNPKCSPPWNESDATERRDFERKIEQARDTPSAKAPGWLLNDDQPAKGNGARLRDGRLKSATPPPAPSPPKPRRIFRKRPVDWPKGEPMNDETRMAFFERLRGWRPGTVAASGAAIHGSIIAWPMRDAESLITGYKLRRFDNAPFDIGERQAESAVSKKPDAVKGSAHNGLLTPAALGDGALIACEGETDMAAAISAGHGAAVATPGATPGALCLAALANVCESREVILAPDGDTAGAQWITLCAGALTGAALVRVLRHGCKDLDDCLQAADNPPARLAELLADAEALDIEQLEAMATRAAKSKRYGESSGAEEEEDATTPEQRDALTELADAKRLADCGRGRLRYVEAWGRWLTWAGTRWTYEHQLGVDEIWRETLRKMDTEAEQLAFEVRRMAEHEESKSTAPFRPETDVDTRLICAAFVKKYRAHIQRAKTARGMEAAKTLCRSEAEIPLDFKQLDADAYLLNTPNGTLELLSGTLREHRPGDLLTRQTGCAVDATGKRPEKFLQFLAQIMGAPGPADTPPDVQAKIDFIQRWFGYCLSGNVSEQKLVIFYGTGANGKSVLFELIQKIMGDYACKLSSDAVCSDKEQHPTERTDLFRKRLAIASEVEGGTLRTGFVKSLTGDDTLKARRMREDFWEFEITAKLLIVGNHKPRIPARLAGDFSLWRRMLLLNFNVTIPAEKRVPELATRLFHHEGPQILGWLAEGCRLWKASGLQIPDSIKRETEEYETDADKLGAFVEQCLVESQLRDGGTKTGVILEAARDWTDNPRLTPELLASGLRKRWPDLPQRKTRQQQGGASYYFYAGIRLDGDNDGPGAE